MSTTSSPRARRFARNVGHGAALLPTGLAATGTLLARRPSDAARRLCGDEPVRPLGRARVLTYSVLTVLLGVVAMIPVGVEVLVLFRGVLYGFVDRGPYDDSWGGPSLVGAWLAHLVIGLGCAFLAALALWVLAGLHRRLMTQFRGDRSPWWALPTTVLACAAAGLLLVGWTRQI